VVLLSFALNEIAIANDLPAIVGRLRNEANTIAPLRFFSAHCDNGICRVGDAIAPPLGSILSGAVEPQKREVICAPEHTFEFTFQESKDAPSPQVAIAYESDTVERLLGDEREATEIVHFLTGSARLEAQEPHSELLLGEAELKRSVFSLAAVCRNAAPQSALFVTERLFGKLVLTITIKPNMEFDILKARLLDLKRISDQRYRTGIGVQGKDRLLRLETRDFRLVLLRTVTLSALRKEHRDWFGASK
jgi:hypothetical protein